jgi:hypothetical protein
MVSIRKFFPRRFENQTEQPGAIWGFSEKSLIISAASAEIKKS